MGRKSLAKIIYILSNINHISHAMSGFQKVYLGRDYSLFQKLEKVGFQNISLNNSQYLPEANDFLVNLDDSFKDDLLMTLTNACSSNKYLTRLCEFVLRGRMILDLIKNEKDILFYVDCTEDAFLYRDFIKANDKDCQISDVKKSSLLNLLRSLKNNMFEVVSSFKNILYLKMKRMRINKGIKRKDLPSVYLISWLNKHSFTNGNFWLQNNYFGFLPDKLRANVSVQVVGRVLSGSLDYTEIVDNALRHESGITFLEDYLMFWDPLRAFFKSLKIFNYMRKKYRGNGIDFSPFVKECLTFDFVHAKYLNSLINFYAFRRLFKGMPEGSKIIYPFENQPWERSLNLSKHLINRNIICGAYQFFPIPRNFLIHRFSKLQVGLNLAPEVIFTSDQGSQKLFHDQNIKTIPLGNVRLMPFLSLSPPKRAKYKDKTILCCLFIDPKEAIELSAKAIEATSGLGCNLWINFHPLLPTHTKEQIYEMADSHHHVEIKNLPFSQLISDVYLVLYQVSSVCYEAALQGVPVIYVESDLEIDLNRFLEHTKSFLKPNEGKNIIQDLIEDEASYNNYSKILYEDAINNIYKVNTEELEKFIQ